MGQVHGRRLKYWINNRWPQKILARGSKKLGLGKKTRVGRVSRNINNFLALLEFRFYLKSPLSSKYTNSMSQNTSWSRSLILGPELESLKKNKDSASWRQHSILRSISDAFTCVKYTVIMQRYVTLKIQYKLPSMLYRRTSKLHEIIWTDYKELNYTATLLSTITLALLGRFLYFWHQWKQKWILQNHM